MALKVNKALMQRRWKEVKDRPLLSGSHSPDGQMCVMEMAAYLADEPWSDHPKCVSPVLGAFLRAWNDALDDETRQKLKPYVRKLIGIVGSPAADKRRAWMATDWLVREFAPAFLRLTKLDAEADELTALPELCDAETARRVQPTINAARKKASAARDSAWAAAGDAARAAARDSAWAAAGAAAGDAAWAAAGDSAWAAAGAAGAATGDSAWAAAGAATGDAAWAAAGDSAWAAAGAAARDAAWAAAGAAGAATGDALIPTVKKLQPSAFKLLDRMVTA